MLIVAEQERTTRHRDALSVTDILSELSPPVARGIASFHLFSSIASTNAYLLANAQDVDSGMHICVADAQTQGYGQHGRVWVSPRGNICMSLASRMGLTQTQSNWLSLMSATGVAEMLSSLGAKGIQVKWPNDVYHRSRKLAGVLIERKSGLTAMGIGLNVTPRKNSSNADLSQPGGHQRATLHEVLPLVPPRNRIIACLLEMLCEVVERCAGAPPSSLQARWNKFDMLADRHLVVSSSAGSVRGRAKGVNANAQLLLDTGRQIKIFSSGNIRIHW